MRTCRPRNGKCPRPASPGDNASRRSSLVGWLESVLLLQGLHDRFVDRLSHHRPDEAVATGIGARDHDHAKVLEGGRFRLGGGVDRSGQPIRRQSPPSDPRQPKNVTRAWNDGGKMSEQPSHARWHGCGFYHHDLRGRREFASAFRLWPFGPAALTAPRYVAIVGVMNIVRWWSAHSFRRADVQGTRCDSGTAPAAVTECSKVRPIS